MANLQHGSPGLHLTDLSDYPCTSLTRRPPIRYILPIRCQGDFGLVDRPKAGSFVDLRRACCNNESGVFVLDQFRGSGKEWSFKVLEVRVLGSSESASRLSLRERWEPTAALDA